MPFNYTLTALASNPTRTRAELNAALVNATPAGVLFHAMVLNLPFGKHGSTAIRATAKTYGARWDGKEWTIPAAKWTALDHAAVEWLLSNQLLAGIKTRTYTPWVWDGHRNSLGAGLALDVPFEDRNTAKAHGAKWEPNKAYWYLPGGQITQNLIDQLNAGALIAGAIDPNTGNVLPQTAPSLTNAGAKPGATVFDRMGGLQMPVTEAVETLGLGFSASYQLSRGSDHPLVNFYLLLGAGSSVLAVVWAPGIEVEGKCFPDRWRTGLDIQQAVLYDRETSRAVWEQLVRHHGYAPVQMVDSPQTA